MLISLIIPLYNAEKYIMECLESVIGQGLPANDFEIIVVDDGSSDSSSDIVQSLINTYPHINLKLVHQKNGGVSAARNRGIQESCGEYLTFVDADDLLFPNTYKIVYNRLKEVNYNLTIPIDILSYELRVGTPSQFYSFSQSSFSNEVGKVLSGIEYIATNNYNNAAIYYLINRKFMQNVNLRFAEGKLCEDGIFTTEAFLKAKTITHLDTLVYFYARRPNSITTTTDKKRIQQLLHGFINSISYFSILLDKHSNELNPDAHERIRNRQASYIFFFLIRLMRLGAFKEASNFIKDIKQKKLYPLKRHMLSDYDSFKFKCIFFVINHKILYLGSCRIVNLLKFFGFNI